MLVLHSSQHEELEGLFESPHDDPPMWACMVTLYLDETIDEENGKYVFAAYLGKKANWGRYVSLWKEGMRGRTSLHLSDMRLHSPAGMRHKELLERLAKVPKESGLRPFIGSITDASYRDLIKGNVAELAMTGYIMALSSLMCPVMKYLTLQQERAEFIFEEQPVFAAQRERSMSYWSKLPQYKNARGNSFLAKWGSIPKSMMTEASDYLAFAFYQHWQESQSQKAFLTSPILKSQRYTHYRAHPQLGQKLFALSQSIVGGTMPLMDRATKKDLRRDLKDNLIPNF